MKTTTKILALVMAAILLVGATIFGTVAYLTSTDEVTNTFTVGKVAITLDEALVDINGVVIEGEEADRVKANEYKLLPGQRYHKDPTVHVAADSEAAFIFIHVKNGLLAIEAPVGDEDMGTIAQQIEASGWTALEDVPDVYYMEYTAEENAVRDLAVFGAFRINGDVTNEALAQYANAEIVVTAYAVQRAGFENAKQAWTTAAFNVPVAP